MKYFTNLPTISYSNNFVRNILTRAKIINDFKKNSSAYYPYVIQEGSAGGLRFENLAFDYYDEADRVWILHLTNEIIDPYYDVPLTEENFNNFIKKKYGSIQKANQRIAFYRNNYYQDESILSISGYESLIPERKRYWTPTINYNNNIIGYERIADDTVITTNKIITIEVVANSALITGEKVVQSTTGASGFVTFSNTNHLTLQHIEGSFSNSYIIIGQDSSVSATPIAGVITLVETISDNVAAYFSPISYYEHERELNEQKKNINIIDNRYASMIESSFIEVMSQ